MTVVLAGSTSSLTTSQNLATGKVYICQFVAAHTGTVEELWVHVGKINEASAVALGIFNVVPTFTLPGALAVSGTHSGAFSKEEWLKIPVEAFHIEAGVTYWFGVLATGGKGSVTLHKEGGLAKKSKSAAFGSLPSTMEGVPVEGDAETGEVHEGPYDFQVIGTESGGSVATLAMSGVVKVPGSGHVATAARIAGTTGLQVTASSRLSGLAALRATASVVTTASGKLAANVSLAGLTKAIVAGTAKLTTVTGTIGELRAGALVKVGGAGKLVAIARLVPTTAIRVGSAGRMGTTASVRGVASVIVTGQSPLRTAATIGAHTVVTATSTSRLGLKAGLGASIVIRVTGSSRVTSTGVARRGLVLYAVVTTPARIPSVVASAQTIHSSSEIE